MGKMKLAEALQRRKELASKIDALKSLKSGDAYTTHTKRVRIDDETEEVTIMVPKGQVSLSEVTDALNWHVRQLRLIDVAIHQANWTVEVEVEQSVMDEYQAK